MLVTVLTVAYNAEKTIASSIESVLKQTYGEIEYIIIDGASKGLYDFYKLAEMLDDGYAIVLVGLSEKQGLCFHRILFGMFTAISWIMTASLFPKTMLFQW